MSRSDMQVEALVIENLLLAIMALQSSRDREGVVALVEMAHDRAKNLNEALDEIHAGAAQ